LLKFAGTAGLTEAALDDLVEEELERTAGIKVDFEIDDALRKLDRIGMCACVDGKYAVAPLARALEILASLPAEPVFAREVLAHGDRAPGLGAGPP
jgi:hypothetical protein